MAAGRRHELRAARPHDAVQGQVRPARVHLGRPLHLPGPDGGRHPALPDGHRPDRRRPAAAPRAHARRCRALQLTLRPDVQAPRGRLPRGRRADHGPPGADEQDVDDGRHAAGHRQAARRAGHDPEEVPLRGHRLGQRGPPRGRQARRHEPDRHPLGADRRAAGRDRVALRRRRLRPVQDGRRRRRRRGDRADPDAVPLAALRPAPSCSGSSHAVRRRRARPRSRRSRRCTSGWASSSPSSAASSAPRGPARSS